MNAVVVFDCVVYAQAMISPDGPAGRCLEAVRQEQVGLVISQAVLDEIAELPGKLKPRLGVTEHLAGALVHEVKQTAILVDPVPRVFELVADPDDSVYVNLAIATEATFVVTRDQQLLRLGDSSHPQRDELQSLAPELRFVTPTELLRALND